MRLLLLVVALSALAPAARADDAAGLANGVRREVETLVRTQMERMLCGSGLKPSQISLPAMTQ